MLLLLLFTDGWLGHYECNTIEWIQVKMHSFETAERKVALCVNATQNKKNISIENRINNDLEKEWENEPWLGKKLGKIPL